MKLLPLTALVVAFGLAGCATIPRGEIQPSSHQIEFAGARGPLSRKRARQVLDRLAAQAPDASALERHLAIEQAIAESPLYTGNHVRILRDGTETFPALFAAIRAARHYVHLEYYIFEDVEYDATHLSDLLLAKRKQGVSVSVIYDGIGSVNTSADFLARLNAAGVTLVEFNPPNPLKGWWHYSLNDRDHRKILIADGTLAIVGGINLSASYQSSPSGSPSTASDASQKAHEPWRDTDLQVEGPVVPELEKLFQQHWREQGGPPLSVLPPVNAAEAASDPTSAAAAAPRSASAAEAPSAAEGDEVVRIIGSSPQRLAARYYITVLSAIRNAEKSIWITAAYFVPTHEELEDLLHAARRGVDVRLLVPSHSDSTAAIAVQRSNYASLLKAGVKIYERNDDILHSKTMVVDGVWSVIGSSNFDHRSVLFNDEVDAVVIGRETGARLQGIFTDDTQRAQLIDAASWKRRSAATKARELFWRGWQRLL